MIEFVSEVANYFAYPQKRAGLRRIQEEKQLPLLYPVKLAPTRWLSLGKALERLLAIWESLVEYFREVEKIKSQKKLRKYTKNRKKVPKKAYGPFELKKLLEDKMFYYKIMLLSYIIGNINQFNIVLQNPKLDISELKKQIANCWSFVLDLTVKHDLFEKTKEELLSMSWEDEENYQNFKSSQEFIKSLSDEVGSKFGDLLKEPGDVQDRFTATFFPFLGKMLNLLAEYLPLEDNILEIIDFIELKEGFSLLKEKIYNFNEKFHIISENEKTLLKTELLNLKGLLPSKIQHYKNSSSSLLHMWDILEKEENFKILSKFARLAQTLPTSSAPIEQSFSVIKLLKTDLRNSLTEESLEGLILIGEEFRDRNQLLITEKLLSLYRNTKSSFIEKKHSRINLINIEPENGLEVINLENENNEMLEELSQKLEVSMRIEDYPLFNEVLRKREPILDLSDDHNDEEPSIGKRVKET